MEFNGVRRLQRQQRRNHVAVEGHTRSDFEWRRKRAQRKEKFFACMYVPRRRPGNQCCRWVYKATQDITVLTKNGGAEGTRIQSGCLRGRHLLINLHFICMHHHANRLQFRGPYTTTNTQGSTILQSIYLFFYYYYSTIFYH